MPLKKTKVHLISGFLGTGKTTALKSLMTQKNPDEKWVIIVNEFGEIGIDGAVLSDNGIPVAELRAAASAAPPARKWAQPCRKCCATHSPTA